MTKIVVITGASRGFGQEVALAAADAGLSERYVLVSRSSSASTAEGIAKRQKNAKVEANLIDFAEIDQLEGKLQGILEALDLASCTSLTWINNHGSLGPLQSLEDFTAAQISQIKLEIDANVTSVLVASAVLLRALKASPKEGRRVQLVNVSSLAAVKPFVAWGVYCAGKAARDMVSAVVAEECKGAGVRTLNYAPGPLDTDMQREIREGCAHEATREHFSSLHQEGKLVSPAQSASKLVALLADDTFESGQHVDYFDLK
eukprot:TRINITY_DN3675_c0_g3_i2.p1 TRINITY_DN3675_c0_g3~~TRINITY_DN3675_c0_g3_i2.p1  ORF type:complete len:260 (-),score=64.50 TRINITY_DN3675_c0_g3_i2:49-828(-)